MSYPTESDGIAEELRQQLSGLQNSNSHLQDSLKELHHDGGAYPEEATAPKASAPSPAADSAGAGDAARLTHELKEELAEEEAVAAVDAQQQAAYPSEAEPAAAAATTSARAPSAESGGKVRPPLAPRAATSASSRGGQPASSVTPMTAFERRLSTTPLFSPRRRSSTTGSAGGGSTRGHVKTPRRGSADSDALGAYEWGQPVTTYHAEEEFAPEVPGAPLTAYERRHSQQSTSLLSPSFQRTAHTPVATPVAGAVAAQPLTSQEEDKAVEPATQPTTEFPTEADGTEAPFTEPPNEEEETPKQTATEEREEEAAPTVAAAPPAEDSRQWDELGEEENPSSDLSPDTQRHTATKAASPSANAEEAREQRQWEELGDDAAPPPALQAENDAEEEAAEAAFDEEGEEYEEEEGEYVDEEEGEYVVEGDEEAYEEGVEYVDVDGQPYEEGEEYEEEEGEYEYVDEEEEGEYAEEEEDEQTVAKPHESHAPAADPNVFEEVQEEPRRLSVYLPLQDESEEPQDEEQVAEEDEEAQRAAHSADDNDGRQWEELDDQPAAAVEHLTAHESAEAVMHAHTDFEEFEEVHEQAPRLSAHMPIHEEEDEEGQGQPQEEKEEEAAAQHQHPDKEDGRQWEELGDEPPAERLTAHEAVAGAWHPLEEEEAPESSNAHAPLTAHESRAPARDHDEGMEDFREDYEEAPRLSVHMPVQEEDNEEPEEEEAAEHLTAHEAEDSTQPPNEADRQWEELDDEPAAVERLTAHETVDAAWHPLEEEEAPEKTGATAPLTARESQAPSRRDDEGTEEFKESHAEAPRLSVHIPVQEEENEEPEEEEAAEHLTAHEAEDSTQPPNEADRQWEELDDEPAAVERLTAHETVDASQYPTQEEQHHPASHPTTREHEEQQEAEDDGPVDFEEVHEQAPRLSVHMPVHEEDEEEAAERLTAQEAEEAAKHPVEEDHQWDELGDEPAVEHLVGHEAEVGSHYPTKDEQYHPEPHPMVREDVEGAPPQRHDDEEQREFSEKHEEAPRLSVHLPLQEEPADDEEPANDESPKNAAAAEHLTAHEAEQATQQSKADDHQWDELDDEPAATHLTAHEAVAATHAYPTEDEQHVGTASPVPHLTAHDSEEAVPFPTEEDYQWKEAKEEKPVKDRLTAHEAHKAEEYPTESDQHRSQPQSPPASMHDVPPVSAGERADAVGGEEEGRRFSDLWVQRSSTPPPQRRLSDMGRKPEITATDLNGAPLRNGFSTGRIRPVMTRHPQLESHKVRPYSAAEGYVSLYADKYTNNGTAGAVSNTTHSNFLTATVPHRGSVDVDGQLADFVASSLIPASRRMTEQQRRLSQLHEAYGDAAVPPLKPREMTGGESRADGRVNGQAVIAAPTNDAAGVVATTPPAAADQVESGEAAVARARYAITSAENGDMVEHDALAGHAYWEAENPKATHYTKPSVLLEAKEQRDCTLFRRYSKNYGKLVEDTARNVGGDAGASIQASYWTFKASCDAQDRRPIHKRSFYAGEAVDWKKLLQEQKAGMGDLVHRLA